MTSVTAFPVSRWPGFDPAHVAADLRDAAQIDTTQRNSRLIAWQREIRAWLDGRMPAAAARAALDRWTDEVLAAEQSLRRERRARPAAAIAGAAAGRSSGGAPRASSAGARHPVTGVRLSAGEATALAALATAARGRPWAPVEEWRAAFDAARPDASRNPDALRKAFNRARTSLVKRGLVVVSGRAARAA